MTTVYINDQLGKPGTHVLIVGIETYPYLADGAMAQDETFGMGQLTSPAISAKAIASWFMGPLMDPARPGFQNATSPLASVEVLIGAKEKEAVETPAGDQRVDGAERSQVKAAFNAWKKRIVDEPGSTGIFYFCGHGISDGAQYALCQDILLDSGTAYEMAFDVDGTLYSLMRVAKDSHIHFWFDACRAPDANLMIRRSRPQPLLDIPATDPTVTRSTSFLQATEEGKLAFARKGAPARFTQAILNSFSGYAARSMPGNKWEASSTELYTATLAFLKVDNKSASNRQNCSHECSGEGAAIIELTAPPKVRLVLDLKPDNMRPHGQLSYKPSGAPDPKTMHQCSAGLLSAEVNLGVYELGAEAKEGQFAPKVMEMQFVMPPVYDFTFEVGS